MRSLFQFLIIAHAGLLIGSGCGEPLVERPPEEPGPRAELVPREAILALGAPRKVRLSPDASRLAYLAESEGELALWVERLTGEAQARVEFSGRARLFRELEWAFEKDVLLLGQDPEGDGVTQFLSFDVETGQSLELTPAGSHAQLVALSPQFPKRAVFVVRDEAAASATVESVDLRSGERQDLKGGPYDSWLVDSDFDLRLAAKKDEHGVLRYHRRSEVGGWVPFEGAAGIIDSSFEIIGIDRAGDTLFWKGRDEGGKLAVVRSFFSTGQSDILVTDELGRVARALVQRANGRVDAVALGDHVLEWRPIESGAAEALSDLSDAFSSSVHVEDRSFDDSHWLVVGESAAGYGHYLFDRDSGSLERLFPEWRLAEWRRATTTEMLAVARSKRGRTREVSGNPIPVTLTLPAGEDPNGDGYPARPVPTLIWTVSEPSCLRRDASRQWLANRGYGVAEVRAGYDEDEFIDWLVDEKIADPDRIAIVGRGASAANALSSVSSKKSGFACAMTLFPGDLEAGSDSVGQVERPLLLAREDDGTARPAWPESTTVVSVRGESANSLRIESQLALAAEVESFLGSCLGGRVEPASGMPVRQAAFVSPEAAGQAGSNDKSQSP